MATENSGRNKQIHDIKQKIDMHYNSINALEGLLRGITDAPYDSCVYVITDDIPGYDEGYIKAGCNDDTDDLFTPMTTRHYKYCPFCGKPIYQL